MKRLLIVVCACALLGLLGLAGYGSTEQPWLGVRLAVAQPANSGTPSPMSTPTNTMLPQPSMPPAFPSPTPVVCANPFVDVSGNVFYPAIHDLNCRGVVSGSDASHFSPAATATRAQFARVVVKGFDLPLSTPITPTFSDVPANYFAYSYIESGLAAGILDGYTAQQCVAANAVYPCFLPNHPISRAELTRLIVRAANFPRVNPARASFADVPPTSFAYVYIETAKAAGVIQGMDASHFAPDRPIRRDEMAQIVYASVAARASSQQLFGSGESYLGVGSPLAAQRSGDPAMRVQGTWLSVDSPGTDKQFGDPFTTKWDDPSTYNGGGGYPYLGPNFQPDHDTSGYNYGIYVPDSSDGYLQIYDAAYQARYPSPLDQTNNQGVYNDISKRWCTMNNVDAGDNQAGAPTPTGQSAQCSLQAQDATTIYSLYYPDSSPWYFNDDTLANSWTVPAAPITGVVPGPTLGTLLPVPSFAYSQTWANFNNAPDPGYRLYPLSGQHQWRLNVNVPSDTSHRVHGVVGINDFAIRVKTNYTGVQVYALGRMGTESVITGSGATGFDLAYVPVSYAGRTLVVSVFDPGDSGGYDRFQLISPPTASNSQPHAVNFDLYNHSNAVPPTPDIVSLNVGELDTNDYYHDPNNYNDRWVDLVYQLPPTGEYLGGYWAINYAHSSQTNDRITWRITFR